VLPALEDVAHALEAIPVRIAFAFAAGPFGDYEETRAFEEEDLVGVDGDAERGELGFDHAQVGD
jgi:hypothetical protein